MITNKTIKKMIDKKTKDMSNQTYRNVLYLLDKTWSAYFFI